MMFTIYLYVCGSMHKLHIVHYELVGIILQGFFVICFLFREFAPRSNCSNQLIMPALCL